MENKNFLASRMKMASDLAVEAGKLLLGRFGQHPRIEHKGVIDIVTDADRAAEDFLVKRLIGEYPDYSIMTEESRGHKGSGPYQWIMDPLDGTTNYAHGFPFFCISIALVRGAQPLVGVVYDPVRDELFTAVFGEGAFLNGKRLKVSSVSTLNESLLATGFPYDIRTSRETNLDYFAAFAVKAQAIRRAGSAALDLCYVAAGRFDGYWEMKLKPWDMAAGSLILTETGGLITDMDGGPFHLGVAGVTASNGHIHRQLLDVIAGVKKARGGT